MQSLVDGRKQRERVVARLSPIDATYVMRGCPRERALETYHLILAPTYACNLRCAHCYLPDHDASRLLPEETALRLVDEWSDIVVEERGPFGGIFHVKGFRGHHT